MLSYQPFAQAVAFCQKKEAQLKAKGDKLNGEAAQLQKHIELAHKAMKEIERIRGSG
jgi:hypothetical protein